MREKIFQYVKKKYKTVPDYPFRTAPTYPVMRHADTRKWFALIMDVPREKLGLKGTEYVGLSGSRDIFTAIISPAAAGSPS